MRAFRRACVHACNSAYIWCINNEIDICLPCCTTLEAVEGRDTRVSWVASVTRCLLSLVHSTSEAGTTVNYARVQWTPFKRITSDQNNLILLSSRFSYANLRDRSIFRMMCNWIYAKQTSLVSSRLNYWIVTTKFRKFIFSNDTFSKVRQTSYEPTRLDVVVVE